MAGRDPLEPDTTFNPPAVPTLVGCLHCGGEYESYRIAWRVRPGEARGFWCCPTPGCDGVGFGCDILPVDPDYEDETFRWVRDDGPDDGEGHGDDPTVPW